MCRTEAKLRAGMLRNSALDAVMTRYQDESSMSTWYSQSSLHLQQHVSSQYVPRTEH